ncbi:type II toxin-antitoxin system RelE/ParE family toxin [bacterium]|nr:type II toxin-antitoxin system RelE/ParE family toxin [bacterium]
MTRRDEPLVWLGGAVTTPPMGEDARKQGGYLLRLLQGGESLGLPRSRPMPRIGPRCHELRIDDGETTWRIVYRIDRDAILVLAVFHKKTRTTPRSVIETCRARAAAYDRDSENGRDDG